MTRLCAEQVQDLSPSLEELDHTLLQCAGLNLRSLAARAAGLDPSRLDELVRGVRAAVVPVSAGKGVITGFAEAVAAVLRHVGLDAAVTAGSDVAGFGEAFRDGAELVLAADDDVFLAFNLRTRQMVDNATATAHGFVEALVRASARSGREVGGQGVVVLGLGPVGRASVRALQDHGAEVWVIDPDAHRLHACLDAYPGVRAVSGVAEALAYIDLVVDATPARDIIAAQWIRPTTLIAAPGVPHGLTAEARTRVGPRLIHDVLSLGVAVMAMEALGGAAQPAYTLRKNSCSSLTRATLAAGSTF